MLYSNLSEIQQKFNQYLSHFPLLQDKYQQIAESLPQEEKWMFYHSVVQMPVTDILSVKVELLVRHVKSIYGAVNQLAYAKDMPEDVVVEYVLPYRVNDEAFSLYSEKFYQELQPLIAGKSIEEAALEVNYQSLGKATYAQADDRTQSAIATERVGKGRCGEESVLLVSMLRSVGIPSRQVYSPYWLHCDDNHAWVEIWTPNGWKFMGACEPEETLCHGWFNHAASRAAVVRHRVFGKPASNSTTEGNHLYSTRYTTDLYGATRQVEVTIECQGTPIANVLVGIYTINYNMPKLLTQGITDSQGRAYFTLGRGDVLVYAQGQQGFALQLCQGEQTQVALQLVIGNLSVAFSLAPSKGDISGRPYLIGEQHKQRIASLTEKRLHRHAQKEQGAYAGYLEQAGENREELLKFLSNKNYTEEEKTILLDTLTHKDFCDITQEVLMDLADHRKANSFPADAICRDYLINPRVKNEHLYPHRVFVQKFCKEHSLITPVDIYDFLCQCTNMDDYDYGEMVGDIKEVLTNRIVTSASLPIHAVQICRALGIPSRLCPLTGEPQYLYKGEFVSLYPITSQGKMELKVLPGCKLAFGNDVTLSHWNGQDFTLLQKEGNLEESTVIQMNGICAITHSSRQIDGSVLGELCIYDIKPMERVSHTFSVLTDCTKEKLLDVGIPEVFPPVSGNAIYACIESGSEPTEHFLNELLEQEQILLTHNVVVYLLSDNTSQNKLLQKVLEKPWATLLVHPMDDQLCQFRAKMEIGDMRLPFITGVKNGKGKYSFANYNVGTVSLLMKILDISR